MRLLSLDTILTLGILVGGSYFSITNANEMYKRGTALYQQRERIVEEIRETLEQSNPIPDLHIHYLKNPSDVYKFLNSPKIRNEVF